MLTTDVLENCVLFIYNQIYIEKKWKKLESIFVQNMKQKSLKLLIFNNVIQMNSSFTKRKYKNLLNICRLPTEIREGNGTMPSASFCKNLHKYLSKIFEKNKSIENNNISFYCPVPIAVPTLNHFFKSISFSFPSTFFWPFSLSKWYVTFSTAR